MAGRLEGKVALITGAASGIGEGTARAFIDEGAKVAIADLRGDAADALAKELGDNAIGITCNVTDEDQIAAAVDKTVDAFGRLDCMFNNAGIVGSIGSIATTDVKDFDLSVSILLRGVFLGMKHAVRVMTPQGSGSIISTSSTAGLAGGLGPHAYTACKHAVIGLTKSVASEVAKKGIRVNAIAPGNIVTNMTAGIGLGGETADLEAAKAGIASMSPLGIAGEPYDIAMGAVYLASDESRYMSGSTILIDAAQIAGGMGGTFHDMDATLVGGIANVTS